MSLRNVKEIKGGLLLILLAMLVPFSSCRRVARGPLSINEVLKVDVRLPVHYIDPDCDSSYQKLDVTYYYFSDSPELRLDTYFTIENQGSEKIRVARMSTFNLNGQLVNTDETKEDPSVPITWAKDGGGACKVFSQVYRNDRITGGRFQSCLYWLDEDLNQYKLYTVWSEEEAVNFANSLIVLEE